MNKKALIFEMLRALALVIGQDITQERLAMITLRLEQYDIEDIKRAIAIAELRYTRFPSFAELVQIIIPSEDKKDIANEMAGNILEAVRTFGYYRTIDAKNHLGGVAWFAVESFGGWKEICMIETANLPTCRAQLRDMCSMAMTVSSRKDSSNLLPFQKGSMKRLEDLMQDLKQIE